MKKILLSALTVPLLVGVASTAFAAENPHGERASAEQFSDNPEELSDSDENLKQGTITWRGKIEYEYDRIRTDPEKTGHKDKTNNDGYIFRFEPSMRVNDYWALHARADVYVDTKSDKSEDFELVRGWAEGDYDKFNVKLGKQELWTNESSLVWDTNFTGAIVTYDSAIQATLLAGRLSEGVGGGIQGEYDDENPASIQGINLQYNNELGPYGGVGWYRVKDSDLKTEFYSSSGDENKANLWTVNAGYRLNDKVNLWGAYAKNTKADYEDNSFQVQIDFGNYVSDYGIKRGDWGAWTGYRRYGTNTSFAPLEDDVMRGTKGWFIGGAYAPMDNIGVMLKYFNGEFITGGGDAEKFMGLIEIFYD